MSFHRRRPFFLFLLSLLSVFSLQAQAGNFFQLKRLVSFFQQEEARAPVVKLEAAPAQSGIPTIKKTDPPVKKKLTFAEVKAFFHGFKITRRPSVMDLEGGEWNLESHVRDMSIKDKFFDLRSTLLTNQMFRQKTLRDARTLETDQKKIKELDDEINKSTRIIQLLVMFSKLPSKIQFSLNNEKQAPFAAMKMTWEAFEDLLPQDLRDKLEDLKRKNNFGELPRITMDCEKKELFYSCVTGGAYKVIVSPSSLDSYFQTIVDINWRMDLRIMESDFNTLATSNTITYTVYHQDPADKSGKEPPPLVPFTRDAKSFYYSVYKRPAAKRQ